MRERDAPDDVLYDVIDPDDLLDAPVQGPADQDCGSLASVEGDLERVGRVGCDAVNVVANTRDWAGGDERSGGQAEGNHSSDKLLGQHGQIPKRGEGTQGKS